MAEKKFTFKKHYSVGAPDAESDHDFLRSCFVETEDLATLLDCRNAKRIVVGRTGAGKTALVGELTNQAKNCIALDPQSLAFNYISNSDIIKFFEAAGMSLDPFYQLLWKHVLAVELIKARYPNSVDSFAALREKFAAAIGLNPKRKKAIDYLESWGARFWEDTEIRVKEITQNLEQKLKASAEVSIPAAIGKLSAEAADSLTEAVKAEVITKSQHVVSQLQLDKLSELIQMLQDDVFTDDQRPFYIVIDKLDENWVDERLRYKLIRALIETIKSFQRVENVKIIAAIRIDLLQRVFNRTRDGGFQSEKFEALMLDLRWTQADLRTLVSKRLNHMLRSQYTKQDLTFDDVFPAGKGKGEKAFDYMVKRTLMRPRDLIMFVNECLQLVEGKSQIPLTMIREAEANYSRKRLDGLADEWQSDYPNLLTYTRSLRRLPLSFTLDDMEAALGDFIDEVVVQLPDSDSIYRLIDRVTSSGGNLRSLSRELVRIFYRCGIVGIKPTEYDEIQWSSRERTSVSDNLPEANTKLQVHLAFTRALGINAQSVA